MQSTKHSFASGNFHSDRFLHRWNALSYAIPCFLSFYSSTFKCINLVEQFAVLLLPTLFGRRQYERLNSPYLGQWKIIKNNQPIIILTLSKWMPLSCIRKLISFRIIFDHRLKYIGSFESENGFHGFVKHEQISSIRCAYPSLLLLLYEAGYSCEGMPTELLHQTQRLNVFHHRS